jgi:hypothetical protein
LTERGGGFWECSREGLWEGHNEEFAYVLVMNQDK